MFNVYDDEDRIMAQKIAMMGRRGAIPIAATAAERGAVGPSVELKDESGKVHVVDVTEVLPQKPQQQLPQQQLSYQQLPQQQLPQQGPRGSFVPFTGPEFKLFKAGGKEFRMNLRTQVVEELTFVLPDTIPDMQICYNDGTVKTLQEFIESTGCNIKVKNWVVCDENS